MIPKGWKKLKVEDFFERVSNQVEVQVDKTYQQIGIRSHGKGIFHKDLVTGEALGNKRVFHIEPNCFVVNIVFAWEQAVAKTTEGEVGMIASHRFPMYKPKDGKCDIDYLLYLFKTKYGKYLLGLASPGGAGRNKTLGQKEFARLELTLPPLAEQKKIAKILGTWDKAIAKYDQLIENAQLRKKALMQQLLTGKKRLPGFDGEWKEVRLGECSISYDNKRVPINSTEREKMLGDIPYWGANGIQSYVNDFIFNETIVLLAEDGGNFEEFQSRPIANISYGKSWVNNHAHVLVAREENCINEWLYYSLVHKNILGYVNGGTRSKLNKSDMLKIPLSLPSIYEQEKITKIMLKQDEEIKALEGQREKLLIEKKALMQQLLTGKKRVKVEE